MEEESVWRKKDHYSSNLRYNNIAYMVNTGIVQYYYASWVYGIEW